MSNIINNMSMFNLIKIIAAAAVIAVLLMLIIRYINMKIWHLRSKRRMKLIAMQEEDASTVVMGIDNMKKEEIIMGASQILGTRDSQQDSFYMSGNIEIDLIKKSYAAVSVCDGMGGLSSGEIASKMAVDNIRDQFNAYFSSNGEKNVPEFLKRVAMSTNQLVHEYGMEHCPEQMCGTTMTLAVFENNYLYWLSIGDSRIYIIRDNQIVQITNDHNYTYILNQKVKEGVMTNEEALNEVNREALISYIGMPELDIIDLSTNPFKLEKEDIVLLCSDGLTKTMSDTEICTYISENKNDIQNLAKMLPLVSFDRNSGSQDNTTAAVVCYR